MKKVALFAIFLMAVCSSASVYAQKIAYVNMQDIVTNMPEYAKADTALKSFSDDLSQQMQIMQQEFQGDVQKYVQDSSKMTDAVKQVKQSELRDLQNRIQQFQQTYQDRLGQKQSDLLKPIVTKAQDAVNAVAKAKGFAYVLNDTGNGDILVVKPAGDDLTREVKARLGIK